MRGKNQVTQNVLWESAELSYVEKRMREGAADDVIATEFPYQDLPHRSPDDIKKMRRHVKMNPQNGPLPEETKPVARPLHLIPYYNGGGGFEKRGTILTATKVNTKTVPKNGPKKIKKSKVGDDFAQSADAQPKAIRVKSSQKSDLIFQAVYPKKFQTGEKYFVPKLGVVEFMGVRKVEYPGAPAIETYAFKQHFFLTSPITESVPAGKLEQKKIRALVSMAFIDQVIEMITKGDYTQTRPYKKTSMQRLMEKYDAIILSGDLLQMSNLLAWSVDDLLKDHNKANNMWARFGIPIVAQIASEYAYVKKVDFKDAMKIIERAAGKPTIEDLVRNDSTKPAELKPAP